MRLAGKLVRLADRALNLVIVLCLLPLLAYGVYAIWDSEQVYGQAESSLYETYRPGEGEDDLSFEELRKLNPDVFGWLTVYGTHIDYPLVQGTDNIKYVNTDPKGEFALSGSLFLDYQNRRDFSDVNSVIYGHHMEKEAMFGELESFKAESFFEGHRYGAVYAEGKWQGAEFFAFLEADAYDPVLYDTRLSGSEGTAAFLDYVREKAKYFRELDFGTQEHFLTLSTCASMETNGRYLLVGRVAGEPAADPFASQTELTGE